MERGFMNNALHEPPAEPFPFEAGRVICDLAAHGRLLSTGTTATRTPAEGGAPGNIPRLNKFSPAWGSPGDGMNFLRSLQR